jgi:hypothetical protein
MRWPLVSRARFNELRARNERLATLRAEAEADLGITGRAFDCIAVELDQAKDVIAHHITATGNTALRDQLAAAGVDMRLHLADAEKRGARP